VHQTSKANIPVYDAPNPISPPNPHFGLNIIHLYCLYADPPGDLHAANLF